MDATEESLLTYFRSLFNESDRGCVLLVVSRLDESLEDLHRTYIKSVAPTARKLPDALFRAHAPLSTFAARIQLGYAYGLIQTATYDDLERLRKIRNDAAHSSLEFSFRSTAVRDRVFTLEAPKRGAKMLPGLALTADERLAVEAPDSSEATTKLYFVFAGMCLSGEILLAMTQVLQADLVKLKSHPLQVT